MFLRWSVKPAVLALNGWARRAEITCDRAGLICTRDVDVSIGCLVKLALGSHKLYSDVNIDEYLAQLDEAQARARAPGRADAHAPVPAQAGGGAAAVRRDDLLPQPGRHRARGRRARGRAPAGTSKDECDAKVAAADRGAR